MNESRAPFDRRWSLRTVKFKMSFLTIVSFPKKFSPSSSSSPFAAERKLHTHTQTWNLRERCVPTSSSSFPSSVSTGWFWLESNLVCEHRRQRQRENNDRKYMIIHLYCCPLIQLFSQSQFDDHAMSSSSSSTLLRSSDYFYMNLEVADLVGAKNKQIGLKYVLNLEISISSLLLLLRNYYY